MKNSKLFTLILLCFFTVKPAFSYDIVVTSRPIYSIVKNVSCDLKVKLIGSNKTSPHDIQLKPSELRSMLNAKMIIITSPDLESSLLKLISNHTQLKEKITLVQNTPNLFLKEYTHREEINADEHHQDPAHEHHHSHDHHGTDPHFWLDISNAKLITNYLAQEISKNFPDKKNCIIDNADAYIKSLSQLQTKLDFIMKNSKDKNIIISHDALSYFLSRYNINTSGVIISNFHSAPSMKKIINIKELANKNKVSCILIEERFNSTPIKKAFTDVKIDQAFFDPEWGPENVKSQDIYAEIMLNNAKSIASCGANQPI